MNARIAMFALAVCAAPAAAQEVPRSLPPVQVEAEAVRFVVDCDHRQLPSQREVGEWTGQRNFSQVYATRARLMGEVGRDCRRSGVEQVRLVSRTQPAARESQLVAIAVRGD